MKALSIYFIIVFTKIVLLWFGFFLLKKNTLKHTEMQLKKVFFYDNDVDNKV